MALILIGQCFFIAYNESKKRRKCVIWKDKEILGQLKNIERKLDMLITMKKSEKINQINKKIGGKKDV